MSDFHLRAERDFLLERALMAGHASFDRHRWWGRSSNALVRFVFGGERPARREFPLDPADLAACYRTVWRLPAHLKPKARPVLRLYRREVAKVFPLAELDAQLRSERRRVAGQGDA